MATATKQVDLNSEQSQLIDCLEQNLPLIDHRRRFQWLYRDNPAGEAWSWFAYDADARKVVGMASVFPRAMRIGNVTMTCGQVGDFAVDKSHRTLGPAVLLQKATFEPAQKGVFAFCYDCPPHDAGLSPFRRLGMNPNCCMQRYARPLRVDRHVEKRLGKGPLGRPVIFAGNLLLRLNAPRKSSSWGLHLAEYTGRFDEEFTTLDDLLAINGPEAIRARRAAEMLNWRYRDDPLQKYRVLTARRHGDLAGFVVLLIAGRDAFIVDLHAFPDAQSALLDGAVLLCIRESLQTVVALLSEGNELIETFQDAAFRLRSKACSVVAYGNSTYVEPALLNSPAHWQFLQSEIMA